MNIVIKSRLFAAFIATMTAIVISEALGIALGSVPADLGGLQSLIIAVIATAIAALILKKLQAKIPLSIAFVSNIGAYLVLNRVLAFIYAGLDSLNVVVRMTLIVTTYCVGLFVILMAIETILGHIKKSKAIAS